MIIASLEWVSAIAALIGAIGTVTAVLIVLFGPLARRPRLSIELQRNGQQSSGGAYWHGTNFTPPSSGSVANSVVVQQIRVWVVNDGREVAKNCRVKLRIVEPQLKGRDSPIEFTLPAFLYYKPSLNTSGLLLAPEPDQVSVDVAAHSHEAFELVFHRVGMQECYPYSLSTFPLNPGIKYFLRVRAYADGASPSEETTFTFLWDGTVGGLPSAITSEGTE